MSKMIVLICFVCSSNIVTEAWILINWIRESKNLPREFVFRMSLRYVRFYLVNAVMMYRFIRLHIWLISNNVIPYWPLTWAEKAIFLICAALFVTNVVLYFVDKHKYRFEEEKILYMPLNPLMFHYPVMSAGLKLTRNNDTAITALAGITAIAWAMGYANILITALFAMKNVMK